MHEGHCSTGFIRGSGGCKANMGECVRECNEITTCEFVSFSKSGQCDVKGSNCFLYRSCGNDGRYADVLRSYLVQPEPETSTLTSASPTIRLQERPTTLSTRTRSIARGTNGPTCALIGRRI